MNRDSISSLTEAQKACLRMVFLHHSSKDIGRTLSISPHTVDNHVKAAMVRLGVQNRGEAARLLFEAEQEQRRELASPSPAIDPSPLHTQTYQTLNDGERTGEDQSNIQIGSRRTTLMARLARFLPLPAYWGDANDLNITTRMGWIIALTVLIALSLGALSSTLRTISEII